MEKKRIFNELDEEVSDPQVDSIVQAWPMLPRRFVLQVKILSLKGQWPLWQPETREWESASETYSTPRGQYLGKSGYSKVQWKAIIERAAQEHGRGGKPLPEHKVQAEYGNGRFSLDNRWAKCKTLEESKRCSECTIRDSMCRVVEKDPFYTRGQCTRCLAHKSVCSLNSASNIKIGKRRRRDESQ